MNFAEEALLKPPPAVPLTDRSMTEGSVSPGGGSLVSAQRANTSSSAAAGGAPASDRARASIAIPLP
jgi:hypothetical protein